MGGIACLINRRHILLGKVYNSPVVHLVVARCLVEFRPCGLVERSSVGALGGFRRVGLPRRLFGVSPFGEVGLLLRAYQRPLLGESPVAGGLGLGNPRITPPDVKLCN